MNACHAHPYLRRRRKTSGGKRQDERRKRRQRLKIWRSRHVEAMW